jgi:hypothetical protein
MCLRSVLFGPSTATRPHALSGDCHDQALDDEVVELVPAVRLVVTVDDIAEAVDGFHELRDYNSAMSGRSCV